MTIGEREKSERQKTSERDERVCVRKSSDDGCNLRVDFLSVSLIPCIRAATAKAKEYDDDGDGG